jgi:NAD(P)-dependent dehydrogenase (short-subunit alcohol dehydrogenase family)
MKRVLITGAASGIGAATVERLRSQEAEVVGLDLNVDGSDGSLIQCDVRDQASVDSAVAEGISRLGGLDVLINCAGIGLPQSAGDRPGDDAHAVIDVNLMGPWRVTGAALDALRSAPSGRGRVVNVASGLAFLTVPFATAYTMSKRGIVAYGDSLRLEHGDAIDVTTVYPGYIKTPIHAASQEDGFELDGVVPEESVEDAARCLTRAALGSHVRDLGTTRRGDIEYRLLRGAPRRLLDAGTMFAMRQAVKRGRFKKSQMAREFVARLQS